MKTLATYNGLYSYVESADQIGEIYEQILGGGVLYKYKECTESGAWVVNNCD